MENNIEIIINSALEKIAQGYSRAKAEWKADKRNPFKDGKFVAYFEAKEAILKLLDADLNLNVILEEITKRFNAAKAEWKADKRNPFKDGKFLAYFELLKMLPAAA